MILDLARNVFLHPSPAKKVWQLKQTPLKPQDSRVLPVVVYLLLLLLLSLFFPSGHEAVIRFSLLLNRRPANVSGFSAAFFLPNVAGDTGFLV